MKDKLYTQDEVRQIKKLSRLYGQAEVIDYLERNLGPDLAINTDMKRKEAYSFVIQYIKLLRLKYDIEVYN